MRSNFKTQFVIGAAAAALVCLTAGSAFADPAVSGLNGKVNLGFGAIGPNEVYGGAGSIDFPVSDSWGAQGDVFLGGIRGFGVLGGAGHIFWRDPSIALIGLYASDQHYNVFGGVDVVKVGGEIEHYLSQNITLGTVVGWEGGDVTSRVFDRSDVTYYPSSDWAISLGHRYTLGVNAGTLGIEYQIPGTNLAFQVQGRLGEYRTSGGIFSVSYAFGEPGKPLSERARHDDPVEGLSDDLSSAGAQSNFCSDVGVTGGGGDKQTAHQVVHSACRT